MNKLPSHFIFSVQAGKYPSHMAKHSIQEMVEHLRKAGENAVEMSGTMDGRPSKSIVVFEPKNINKLHRLAMAHGQESSILSDGFKHQQFFYYGDKAGHVKNGRNTVWSNVQPKGDHLAFPVKSGTLYFQHRFDSPAYYPDSTIPKLTYEKHDDPWDMAKYLRGGDQEFADHLANRPLKKHDINDMDVLGTPWLKVVNGSLEGDKIDPEKVSFDDKFHLPGLTYTDLWRSYKNSPHNPVSLGLKYLVHRMERANDYLAADADQRDKLDGDFLELHQRGGAKSKNGHITVDSLRKFAKDNANQFSQLLKGQTQLHNFLKTYSPHAVRDINGEPHVALSRALNTDKPSQDHALASYADVPEPGFGSVKHRRLVPLKNIWYSFDLGPKDSTSANYGSEMELVTSPHGNLPANREDIKQLVPRSHYSDKFDTTESHFEFKLAAKHPDITVETLKSLAGSANSWIAKRAMEHSNATAEVLDEALKNPNSATQNDMVYAPNLQPRHVDALLNTNRPTLVHMLSANVPQLLNKGHLDKIFGMDESGGWAIHQAKHDLLNSHPLIDYTHVARGLESPHDDLQRIAAEHLGPENLDAAINHPNWVVRHYAARHPGAQPHHLEKLKADPEERVNVPASMERGAQVLASSELNLDDIFPPMKKTEDLQKEVLGEGPHFGFAHGIIHPDGRFVPMQPHENHHFVTIAEGYPGSNSFVKQGGIQVGHGGTNTITAHKNFRDPNHPAIKTLRSLIKKGYLAGKMYDSFSLFNGPTSKEGPNNYSTKHFVKYGTLVPHDPTMKSEDLQKEDFTGNPNSLWHGFITSKGEFIHMTPKEGHHTVASKYGYTDANHAAEKGCILVGHGGEPIFSMNSKMHTKGHPAFDKLRSLANQAYKAGDIGNTLDVFDYGKMQLNNYSTDRFIKYGTFVPYDKTMSTFKSEDLDKSEHQGICCMFVFEGCEHPDVLHVTHKYFRELKDIKQLKQVLKEYFDEHPFKDFTVKFDKIDHFGEDKEARVLRPEAKEVARFLPELKEKLDEIEEDKFKTFKPHVSVSSNVDEIEIPIVNYIVVQNNKVLWSAKSEE